MIRKASLAGAVLALAACKTIPPTQPPSEPEPKAANDDRRDPRETHLGALVQLTDGGENAEAYWAWGGDKLIFQTTRDGIACDQIMSMPADRMAAPTLMSTGEGRTTCSYYFPGDQEILYASTHAVSKTCPPPADQSLGYVWSLYDFDIYKRATTDGAAPTLLFGSPGHYDAEATICGTDGSVVFTSDKDGDLELYRMDKDGGNVVRLTNQPGYDGGAFFSADCTKLVWRASRPTGADLADYQALLGKHLVRPTKLEIWTANADGSDPRQVTNLDAASFAPFFHPSGKRILFASNVGDPKGREFEIWAIDADGTNLERITYAPGFDGFPMFSPDGKHLAFSSNRGSPPPAPGRHSGDTNVFVAEWIEHPPTQIVATAADRTRRTVDYLADDLLEGRGVGTRGLEDAQKWLVGQLRDAGAVGGLPDGEMMQQFEVTTSLILGATTALTVDGKPIDGAGFMPSPLSASGTVDGTTVFAGFGIVAKPDGGKPVDDYKGKDVKGKIVVVKRFTPAGFGVMEKSEYGDLSHKAMQARQRGAKALVVVDLPTAGKTESPLPVLAPHDGADAGIPIIVVTKAVGERLTKGSHQLGLVVELTPGKTMTGNVVGVIRAGAAAPGAAPIVVGAHLDHLGFGGRGTGALDTDNAVHNGADDNASGIAGLLEVAHALAPKAATLRHDIYLIGFSGEEMGILGSKYFTAHTPYAGQPIAMLNMDMIGRLHDNRLQVLGAESAAEWGTLVPPICVAHQLVCQLAGSGYGPSDHMSFYTAGAPVLHFFTGGHLDYHRVSDDAPLVNAAGVAQVGALVADLALALDAGATATYKKEAAPPSMGDIPVRGASLGTIPTYGDDSNLPGVLVSDVVPGGAADKAGLKKGDRITKIGVTDVRNVEDLMLVLSEAVPGQQATVIYTRAGQSASTKATFGAPRARR